MGQLDSRTPGVALVRLRAKRYDNWMSARLYMSYAELPDSSIRTASTCLRRLRLKPQAYFPHKYKSPKHSIVSRSTDQPSNEQDIGVTLALSEV
jgi:hypothetical protein